MAEQLLATPCCVVMCIFMLVPSSTSWNKHLTVYTYLGGGETVNNYVKMTIMLIVYFITHAYSLSVSVQTFQLSVHTYSSLAPYCIIPWGLKSSPLLSSTNRNGHSLNWQLRIARFNVIWYVSDLLLRVASCWIWSIWVESQHEEFDKWDSPWTEDQ